MIKRAFDIIASFFALVLLAPLFLVLGIIIMLDSRGGVFFKQARVGKAGNHFMILKFRTMQPGSEKKGQLTIGGNDSRITKTGSFLRKYKLDELPQLWNVLTGDMSLVGPRPEVPEFVQYYNDKQKKVLSVKPGITDYASIQFYHESEMLAHYPDPKKGYIEEIMPLKLQLNLEYMERRNLWLDVQIIIKTLSRIADEK